MKTNSPLLTLALGLVTSLGVRAEVVELRSYADVPAIAHPDTLLVFDLDNTIIAPVQTIGSDQWGSLQQKRFREQGLPAEEAVDRGVAMFAEVQMKTRVRLTEPGVRNFIRSLQARGFHVMGLTARPMNLVDRTLEELASVGVDLSRTAIGGFIPPAPDARHEVRYKGGILFVGPHNKKGPVLKTFLNGQMPAAIRFFDDKTHHVEDLEDVFARETNYTGYRYNREDANVANMDPVLGDFEWHLFKTWGVLLSDDEARHLMASGNY